MLPVDKFADLETVYRIFAGEEDNVLNYVWSFAIVIHSSEPIFSDTGYEFYGSYAIGTFKKRYNERLIKMPFTYEEYKTNKDIQVAITGLGLDVDRFWFSLLFIWDYVDGQCWQAFEYGDPPVYEIRNLIKALSQYEETPDANYLANTIHFNEEVTLSLQVKNKPAYTVKSPNAIKFLLSQCQDYLDEEKRSNRDDINGLNWSEENMGMLTHYAYKTPVTASTTKRICLFAQTFLRFFDIISNIVWINVKGKRNAHSITFLISQLIYLTGISDNENFLADKTTLKGYLSKNKNFRWHVNNKIY